MSTKDQTHKRFGYKKKLNPRPPKTTERIIIGRSDESRRENLLRNAEFAETWRVKKQGKHLLYTVGNPDEYLIVDASLPIFDEK